MINKPIAGQLAWTAALLLAGVAAGMFLMDFFGYYPLLPRPPDQVAIQLHQEALPLHRALFQAAVVGSVVTCIILVIFFSEGTARRLLIASLACWAVLVVYTNLALIPLNREIGTWVPGAPPTDWKRRFTDMIFRERLRSFLPTLAYTLELVASWRRRDRVLSPRPPPDRPFA